MKAENQTLGESRAELANTVNGPMELPQVVRDLIGPKLWDRDDLYDTSPHQIAHWHNESLEEVAMFFWEAFQSAESAVRMGLRIEEALRNQLSQRATPSVEPKGAKAEAGSEFSQTLSGGRNALNLQGALEKILHQCKYQPSLPVALDYIENEARKALQSAQAASDGKEQGFGGKEASEHSALQVPQMTLPLPTEAGWWWLKPHATAFWEPIKVHRIEAYGGLCVDDEDLGALPDDAEYRAVASLGGASWVGPIRVPSNPEGGQPENAAGASSPTSSSST